MKITVLMFLFFMLAACKSPEMEIKAIDPELNAQLISLKGIDQRLLGAHRTVQYFQVSGVDKINPEAFKLKLLTFMQNAYPKNLSPATLEVNLFFYRSRLSNYSRKSLYEAAMESEEGRIEGQGANLLALIRLSKLAGGDWIRKYNGYSTPKSISAIDTLNFSQGEVPPRQRSEKISAGVMEGRCLKVVTSDKQFAISKCYQVDFLEIRAKSKLKLSLTFVSGKNAIDADFYASKSGWLTRKISFFGATSAKRKGISKNIDVMLSDFDFSEIAKQFL